MKKWEMVNKKEVRTKIPLFQRTRLYADNCRLSIKARLKKIINIIKDH